jgi:hypothetical protein
VTATSQKENEFWTARRFFTVIDYRMARASLDYDFGKKKEFDYSLLDNRQAVEHIVKFISGLWQIYIPSVRETPV